MRLFMECKYWQVVAFPGSWKRSCERTRQEKLFLFFSTLGHVILKVRTFSKFARKRQNQEPNKSLFNLFFFYLKLQSRSFTQWKEQGRRKRKQLTYKRRLHNSKTQTQTRFSLKHIVQYCREKWVMKLVLLCFLPIIMKSLPIIMKSRGL